MTACLALVALLVATQPQPAPAGMAPPAGSPVAVSPGSATGIAGVAQPATSSADASLAEVDDSPPVGTRIGMRTGMRLGSRLGGIDTGPSDSSEIDPRDKFDIHETQYDDGR